MRWHTHVDASIPVALVTVFLAVIGLPAAGSASTAPAAVTAGREDGEDYGPPPPPGVGDQRDDPEGRRDWLLYQRTYPFKEIPADAYEDAAREYLSRRELTRQLHLRSLAGDPTALGPLPSGPWSEAGPSPIFPSGWSYGPVAGRISAVALHPTNPNVMLIGASRGGLWRTVDAAATWTPVGDNQTTLAIADIEFAPSNPSIVYAATGDDDVSFWGAGVLKSTDGGATWARVDNGSAATGIVNGTVLSKIVVDPTDPNKVTAAGYVLQYLDGFSYLTRIFRSTNGGVTWSKATIPSAGSEAQFRSLVIEANCPANLWSVNHLDHAINRSTDGGATWTAVATAGLPTFFGGGENTQLAVQHASCAGSATLYASVHIANGLAGSAEYPGVYRSTDNGATWSLPGAAGPSGGCLSQCWYDHFLLVDPTDASRVYMIGRDVWTSTNSGATWVNRSGGFDDANGYHVGNMHVDLHDMAIRGAGATAVVYVGGDGSLWSYDVAANTFTNRNGNLAISEFIDLALDPDTPGQAIAGLQDNGVLAYNGTAVWPLRVHGDGGPSGWLPTVAGAGNPFDGAFSTYINNASYLSVDSGATFAPWSANASFASESSEFYGPWIATTGNNRVWHGARSLWYCNFPSACASWTKQGSTNLAMLTGSAFVSKLAIHNPAIGVFGPFYAANANPRAFLQSADGLTWFNRTGTLPNRYISRIVFDPASTARVWVTLQGFGTGHVFYSSDGGTTWNDKSGNLPNVPVNGILLDPQDRADTWYLATDAGVYGTVNGSAASPSWSVVGTGLPVVMVSDLELDVNRLLYAGTGGRSVWTIQLPGCSFGGIASATNTSTAACQIGLDWSAATAACGAGVKYNVYRSTAAGVLGPRIGACLTGTNYDDQSMVPGTTYFYTVRSETSTPGAGPCGGTEDTNATQRRATATGSAGVTAFSDTFESGSGLNGWVANYFNIPGNSAVDWRGIESCANHTGGGARDFRCGGATCAGQYSANKWAFAYPGGGPGITFPPGASSARLSFWHKWDFEPGYDGGQILISTGALLSYIPAGAFLAGGPNGTLIDDALACGFPRPGGVGQSIWTGTSTAAFTHTILDLDAACNSIAGNVGGCAGKSVQLAFTENTNCSVNLTGWFLDDVEITYNQSNVCSASPAPAEVSSVGTPALRIARNGGNLDFNWQDLALSPEDYNIYEGTLGTWYSHASLGCHLTPPAITCGGGTCTASGLTPKAGNRYYLVTASGPGGEGNAGPGGWSGPDHTIPPSYTAPVACGGN